MSRLFICSVVPQEYVVELKASQAANNFCNRLIEKKCFDDVYSVLPISYHLPVVKKSNINYFVNKGKNILSKMLYFIKISMDVINKSMSYDNIWFYNINNTNMIIYFFLRYFSRKRLFVIITDYTLPQKVISVRTFISNLLYNSNGIISLSSRSCFKTIKNKKIIAGIVDEKMLCNEHETKKNNIIFLFSGTLSRVTGFEMALKVFSKIPQAQLYISGNGDFIETYRNYKNIHFLGNLEYNDYLELLEKSTVCLNFRDSTLPENNNNFPSKILDYFSRGKIVLSTIKYPEINGANYLYCDFDENVIINTVKCILKMPLAELKKYSDNINYLRRNFSLNAWEQAILEIESYQNNGKNKYSD